MMEAHLISSDTSDNESPTIKEKPAMAPLATDVTMETINSSQSQNILPSTSAQAIENETEPVKEPKDALSSSMVKKQKKKGFLLALDRMNTILLHIVVPLILLICIVLKISFQSLFYLFMLLILPFLYPVNKRTISNRLKNFLIILIVLSSGNLFAQLVFQIVLLSNQPYANPTILPNCSFKEEILSESGFSRLDTAFILDIFRIIVPDVLLLTISVITLSICQHLNKYNKLMKIRNAAKQNSLNTTAFTDNFCPLTNVQKEPSTGILTAQITTTHVGINGMETVDTSSSSNENFTNQVNSDRSQVKRVRLTKKSETSMRVTPLKRFLNSIVPFLMQILFLCLMFTCASLWPSILAIPYFIIFIIFMTKWSISKRDRSNRVDFFIKLFLIFYLAAHILVSYHYQFHFFQVYSPSESLISRILGFNKIIFTKCQQPAHFYFNEKFKWQQLVYPFALLSLYWFLTLEFSYGSEKRDPHYFLSPPRSPAIPSLPSVAVARPIASKKLQYSETNESILNSPETEAPETQHLFHSDENLKTATKNSLELPLRKAKSSLNNTNVENSSMIGSMFALNQERLKIGQAIVNFEYIRMYLNSSVKFLRKQSYLLMLISMMAWSILYHSILTFVLLIWACFIWVLPSSRKWCLISSPLLTTYSIGLLCLEFIYGLQLTSDELPEYREIGLVRHVTPFADLSIKVGLMLTFWLTQSQYLIEKRKESDLTTINQTETFQSGEEVVAGSELTKKRIMIKDLIINWIQLLFVKYWILLSSGMLLLMSCQNDVVAYRIGYMILFLYFITTFQVAYPFWRYSLYVFHSIVVLYSMIVLILIYVFQFQRVQFYVKNTLQISELVLSSIGFEKLAKDQLAVRLLTPTTFLIVNIIQIHYFNEPWLKLTDSKEIIPDANPNDTSKQSAHTHSDENINQSNEEKKKEDFLSFVIRMIRKITHFYCLIVIYIWRIAEIHVYKCVVLFVGIYCLYKVSLLNLILFILLLFSLFIERLIDISPQSQKKVHSVFSGLFQAWVCVMTIFSMIYQLKFIDSPLMSNCTFGNNTENIDPFLLKEEDNLVFIGIEKSKDIVQNLKFYILIIILLTAQKIIKIKSKYISLKTGVTKPIYSTIFHEITWKELDTSILNFFKYLVNFFFYRFGLEICFFMTAIVIILRMDAYALLYGVWLGMFTRQKRKTICKLWTSYFAFLLVILVVQYIFCLGLPPILCKEYPWSIQNQINPVNLLNKIRIWLFLPDYSDPPHPSVLIADFFQVFFVWLQFAIFRIEMISIEEPSAIIQMGGSNNEIVYDSELMMQNPYHDFVSVFRNNLDKIKYGLYMYSYWFVLAMVFYTGTSRISILCMGYVVLSFFFFWYGQTFLIKPIQKLIKLWNILVFYCFIVIFTKACLQIVLCLLTDTLDLSDKTICILIDLFGVDCRTVPGTGATAEKTACTKDGQSENVGLIWDVFCFIILLIQRRIYMSYMFQYVVNEYKAQSTLAARGAEIFKHIIQRRVDKEKKKEVREFKRLRERVERIKLKRLKQNEVNEAAEPKDYYTSIRSGDYYMFESEFEISDSDGYESDVDGQMGKKSPRIDSEENEPKATDEEATTTKKITFQSKESIASEEKVDEIKEIEILGDNENNKSWLTIENKTTLSVVYYIKKALYLTIDFIIDFFNRYSKDFRIVSHVLAKEKLLLKQRYGNSQTPAIRELIQNLNSNEVAKPSLYDIIEREDNSKIIYTALYEIEIEMSNQSRFDKLTSSTFYFLLSQSETVCYFFLIINHLKTASVLSVPLPVAVFLWAMLGVPRPKKSFWITIITYVEAIVVIKYIFQFKIFSWNIPSNNAADQNLLKFVKILGIDRKEEASQFAIYDLFVLLVIFLHRTILKTMGLWRNSSADDDALIAKTDTERNSLRENPYELNDNEREESDVVTVEQVQPKLIKQNEKLVFSDNFESSSNDDDDDDDDDDYDSSGSRSIPLKDRIRKRAQSVKNQKLMNPCMRFYEDLSTKHYAVVVDCYAKMFLCDFINCIITIFTYQYFGDSANSMAKSNASAISSIKDNKVPISFLIMFLLQFILMIIDRALYLRKNIHGKFVFQVILVIAVHVWIFFALPFMTSLSFTENKAAQVWYFVKCIYFGFSSRQIRCGFPKRILGNFVTKSYNYLNLVLFKGFLLVPFLLELRALMDWMFTDTSFSLFDWLQMEDIYSNIFVLKCQRYNENKYPTPRGQKRNAIVKYGFGGTLLVIIILIIWFPLLLFSFSEGFNRSVPPSKIRVNLQFAGFLPIYSMTSQQRLFQQFTENDFNNLKKASPEEAYGFFKDFKVEDIYCISIPGNSTSLWELSPPSFHNLKEQLKEKDSMKLDFIYEISRESTEENEQLSEVVSAMKSSDLNNKTKTDIYNVLNNGTDKSIFIPEVYPRFSHVRAKGNIVEIEELKSPKAKFNYYADVVLTLNEEKQLWWDAYDDNRNPTGYQPPCAKPGYLNLIVFSDKVSPSSISFITEQGIIGIYITLVLAVSRILRFMVVNSSMRIMFEQLPNVDRILKLLNSIYMVRENKKFGLEEKLFSKLIFLYRSTETMIKYTKIEDPLRSKKNQ